jgi:Phage integrase family
VILPSFASARTRASIRASGSLNYAAMSVGLCVASLSSLRPICSRRARSRLRISSSSSSSVIIAPRHCIGRIDRALDLDGEYPSLLVRRGKGGKPRRQPIPAQLAAALKPYRRERNPSPADPVFCGLRGGVLQPTALARIVSRSATRAEIAKHVTAHTLRHTAATWLRQTTGDTRLVAEYLGHSDLSTVSRYAHVTPKEMHIAVQALADQAQLPAPPADH